MDAKSKAQKGLDLLKEAFFEEIENSKGRGQGHTEIARKFGIHDDIDKGYLQRCICMRLKADGKIKRGKDFDPPKADPKDWWIAD